MALGASHMEPRGHDEDERAGGGGASVRYVRREPGAEEDPPAARRPLFAVRAAGKTDRGRRRAANEDAMLLLRKRGVYAVADGMGGHAGGAVASELAVEAIATVFLGEPGSSRVLTNVPLPADELVQSLAAANESIRRVAARDAALAEMGTTIVAARFCPYRGRVYVGHVGDSRCYRLRNGALELLTRDHTMAEQGFSGSSAAHLSRAVGPNEVVEADVAVLEMHYHDVFLLCSDGLTKMVTDDAIRGVLLTERGVRASASALVARANEAGGHDNVTVVVVHVAMPRGGRPPASR